MKKLKSIRGITMIELMVTVVIIGLVSAMAVPRMQNAFDRIKFRTANKEVVSALRVARSAAITEKTPYGVYFGNDDYYGGEVSYEGGATSGLVFITFKDIVNLDQFTYDHGDSVIRVDSLPSGFTALGTNLVTNAIIFQPSGSVQLVEPPNGGKILIGTMAYSEHIFSIHDHSVLPSTGKISTESYYY